jgi:hypothetical protein
MACATRLPFGVVAYSVLTGHAFAFQICPPLSPSVPRSASRGRICLSAAGRTAVPFDAIVASYLNLLLPLDDGERTLVSSSFAVPNWLSATRVVDRGSMGCRRRPTDARHRRVRGRTLPRHLRAYEAQLDRDGTQSTRRETAFHVGEVLGMKERAGSFIQFELVN